MATDSFSLAQVLAVAKVHPFYNSQIKYPPNGNILDAISEAAKQNPGDADLRLQPLARKGDL